MVDPSGMISTVAGGEERSFQGDKGDGRSAPRARVDGPASVDVDSAGNLFILKAGDSVVRRVDPSGEITTEVARAYGGPATEARLRLPTGVAVDSSGTLYVADMGNFRVCRIDPSGTIVTVADPGEDRMIIPTSSPPSIHQSTFGAPQGIVAESSGSVYVVVGMQGSVLRIAPSGRSKVVAEATTLPIGLWPEDKGVAVDSEGNVYVADLANDRI